MLCSVRIESCQNPDGPKRLPRKLEQGGREGLRLDCKQLFGGWEKGAKGIHGPDPLHDSQPQGAWRDILNFRDV
jgi:hypothetical protein